MFFVVVVIVVVVVIGCLADLLSILQGDTQHIIDQIPDILIRSDVGIEGRHFGAFDSTADAPINVDRATAPAINSGCQIPRLQRVSPSFTSPSIVRRMFAGFVASFSYSRV